MIEFHGELDSSFEFNSEKCSAWLNKVAGTFEKEIIEINFHFVNDAELLGINQEHLRHDYYTDIITFDYCIDNHLISDIFISYERVEENAENLNVPPSKELHRVIVHGVLHLIGFKDKSDAEAQEMRKQEDFCLSLR